MESECVEVYGVRLLGILALAQSNTKGDIKSAVHIDI